eukprot:2204852-Rhodomonas_salina.1
MAYGGTRPEAVCRECEKSTRSDRTAYGTGRCLRARSAMPGTDIAYGGTWLRARCVPYYTESGTNIACPGTTWKSTVRCQGDEYFIIMEDDAMPTADPARYHPPRLLRVRACYAMSGTDIAYGDTCKCAMSGADIACGATSVRRRIKEVSCYFPTRALRDA